MKTLDSIQKDYIKRWDTVAQITQLLHTNNCSYEESFLFLNDVIETLSLQQRELEYDDISDFMNHHKTRDVSDLIVRPVNCVSEFIELMK